jgi:hypothetical protein
MSKFKIKKLPPIKLTDLLRKRKTNLKNFLSSCGIVAYSTLLQKCDKMGVSAPSEEEFKTAIGKQPISSPQEGVVVLDPPMLVVDSGKKIEVDALQGVAKKDNLKEENQKKAVKKNEVEKKLKIDESIFITSVKEDLFEKAETQLGDESSVEDNLNSSVTKLSTLKKDKSTV